MKRIRVEEVKGHTGEEVKLAGWVHVRRDHGKLVFIDLRDETGIVQMVVSPKQEKALKAAEKVRPEYVVEVEGTVNKRPEGMENKEIPTGDVEIEVKKLTVLNKAKTPPFEVAEDTIEIGEDNRLKYRYIDLRTERMQKNMRKRAEATAFAREFLIGKGFVEIETPILTKTTPEGARDFLVPSRLQPGKFYALPQSPQQYKQLLMVAGFERYFQIARCFRDEDPRADRAYGEFTQIDMEMSFVTQDDILNITEELFTEMVKKVFPEKKITQTPWPRVSYEDAMKKYGDDKFDMRKNKEDKDELAFAWVVDFPLFTKQTEEDYFHGSGSANFAPSHHMFTAPHPDDIKLLNSDPTKVRGLQHDLVLNGYEVGGGSIRIHDPKIQEKIFELIGFTDEQKKQFVHTLEAFTYGVPPHGGIAPGLDRLLMVIMGEQSLRELMAFPMTGKGQTAVMDAPTGATNEQLKELGVKTTGKKWWNFFG